MSEETRCHIANALYFLLHFKPWKVNCMTLFWCFYGFVFLSALELLPIVYDLVCLFYMWSETTFSGPYTPFDHQVEVATYFYNYFYPYLLMLLDAISALPAWSALSWCDLPALTVIYQYVVVTLRATGGVRVTLLRFYLYCFLLLPGYVYQIVDYIPNLIESLISRHKYPCFLRHDV